MQSLTNSAAAIARSGDTIFFTDFQNIELRSIPLAGGTSKVLWKGRAQPMDQLGDIALDDKYVFFVEDGQILRIPQEGGRWDILVRERVDFPGDIDVDATHVYWTSGNVDRALIKRVAKTGGAPETVYDGPRGGSGIIVKDGFVYFHGSDRSLPEGQKGSFLIRVEAKPHGAVTELAQMAGAARDITLSGDEIFWADKGGSPAAWTIHAVKTTGGAVRDVATLGESNDVQPYSLVSDSKSLYWAQSQTFDWSASPPGRKDAMVFALPLTGGTPRALAKNLDGAPILAQPNDACPVWGGRYDIATVDTCH
ncbi:MAG: hypothetical protein KIT84_00195 [Labilithrix sp.]|nr:hypothetical protein [Labilithrix sp.]MCW5809402.1 hypothetical protein [Labilithrix sp.]